MTPQKEKLEPVWVGYARVSTQEQVDSGLGLEAQREKIHATAQVRGVVLAEMIEDAGYTSANLERPGAQRIIEMARGKQLAGVVVAKLDRLTRKVTDLAALVELFNKREVALVSAYEFLDTSTAGGRMVLNLVTTVAQWEREVIGERTSAALQAKLKRGQAAGNPKYGWKSTGKDSVLEEDPQEQAIRGFIQDGSKQGVSLRKMAAMLNEQGLLTRAGTKWEFQYVANVLKGTRE